MCRRVASMKSFWKSAASRRTPRCGSRASSALARKCGRACRPIPSPATTLICECCEEFGGGSRQLPVKLPVKRTQKTEVLRYRPTTEPQLDDCSLTPGRRTDSPLPQETVMYETAVHSISAVQRDVLLRGH